MTDELTHGMNCSGGQNDRDCTCGLEWRIKLRTEQEMHAAWRKRGDWPLICTTIDSPAHYYILDNLGRTGEINAH